MAEQYQYQNEVHFIIDSFTSSTSESTSTATQETETTDRTLMRALPTPSQIPISDSSTVKVSPDKPFIGRTGRKNYKKTSTVTVRALSTGQFRSTTEATETYENSALYDTIWIQLPQYFVNSSNPKKSIDVLMVRVFDVNNGVELVASVHSDIVQMNKSSDSYMCAANQLYPIPKKYIMPDNTAVFEVWVRRMDGNILDLDPDQTRVVMELLLKY